MQKKLRLYTETILDSCHQLRGYDGKCSNMHGHSWKISIWIEGNVDQRDEVGILFDFGNIKQLHEKYDHQFINEIPPFDKKNATAENLCIQFYKELVSENPMLQFVVRVYETAVGKETYCQYGDFNV